MEYLPVRSQYHREKERGGETERIESREERATERQSDRAKGAAERLGSEREGVK